MGKQQQYKSVLEKLYEWLEDAAQQEVVDLVKLVEKGKAYIHAAEDLTRDELDMLENYLTRDLQQLQQHWQQDADNSLWWQTNKLALWELLAKLADTNQLAWQQARLQMKHDEVYRAGEVVAFGTLVCKQCKAEYNIDHVETIVACPECGSEQFSLRL